MENESLRSASVFSQSEMSETLTEICRIDPTFDTVQFLRIVQYDIVPNIFEVNYPQIDSCVCGIWSVSRLVFSSKWLEDSPRLVYRSGRSKERRLLVEMSSFLLRSTTCWFIRSIHRKRWITNIIWKSSIWVMSKWVKTVCSVLFSFIRRSYWSFQLLAAKMMEMGPVLIVNFQAQQIAYIADPTGKVIEGDPVNLSRLLFCSVLIVFFFFFDVGTNQSNQLCLRSWSWSDDSRSSGGVASRRFECFESQSFCLIFSSSSKICSFLCFVLD